MHYLAAPYSGVEDKEKLMEELCKVDALLMKQGTLTVSPLMKHFIIHHAELPGDWEFWQNYSKDLLDRCDSMIIVMFHGWETSIGVQAEIEYCNLKQIPIVYFDPYAMMFRDDDYKIINTPVHF